MASLLNWIWTNKTSPTKDNTTQRSLPATWYHNPELYALERRAIFSKSWLLATHKLRFIQPGDYLRITHAGFTFILCLDKSHTIRGYHNICRHRGFPLVHSDSGNAKIFACKYHGWSYGLNGHLAKAQHFESLSDFKKQDHNLLPIHIHIDTVGFIWVNLEARLQPSILWTTQLEGVDLQPRFQNFDFTEYRFDHTWTMDGDFNWKTLADNYNECLHCLVAHPDTVGLLDVRTYRVEGSSNHLIHLNKMMEDGLTKGTIQPTSTYYFPNACMTVSPHFFYLMRCSPTSATTVTLQYEVFRHRDATDDEFEFIDSAFKRILAEDKWLCNHTQENLEAGVYVNGPLHPKYESGPVYFQELVRRAVEEHMQMEKRIGKEVWPARMDGGGTEDQVFCDRLKCAGDGKWKDITW